MLEGVEWGEYRLGDLFESENGDFDIQKHHINDLGEYVVTAGLSNNGVLGRSNVKAKVFFPQTFTVDMFGTVFYRVYHYKMVTHARVFSLSPKFEVNNKQGTFIATALSRICLGFGYENMCSWVKIRDKKVQLPTRRGKIDFEFMEKFIAELNAYLSITGLNNYTLTPEEEQALADFEAGKTQWGAYRFDAIFDCIKQGRRLKKDDQKEGSIPFVMAGVSNTGVVGYISNPIVTFPSNSITIDIFGNTFYRSYSFGAGDDTGVYWREDNRYSKEQMLYFATSMGRSLEGKYSYGKKLRSSQSIDAIMMLPQGVKERPDYEGMSLLISAVQKLVIKDVALYAERELHATQAVITQD